MGKKPHDRGPFDPSLIIERVPPHFPS